jgi:bifunctional non-homologous end joining protein LigD
LAPIQTRFTIAGLIEQMSLSFIEPTKALPVEKLPKGDWLYEIKFDGYRALGFKDGKRCALGLA